METVKRYVKFIIALPFVVFIVLFIGVALTQGVEEAVSLSVSAPQDLFCSLTSLCDVEGDDETEVLELETLWTRIHERALLDTGKYETRQSWKAQRRTGVGPLAVTHSMRMRATVNVTMALNLENVQQEDIVVDNVAKTVTVTLPPAQPVECFLEDIDFYDESCLLVCDDLKKDLQDKAPKSVIDSDEFALALDEAYENGKNIVQGFLSPVAQGYQIIFVQSDELPLPIPSGSCPQ